MTGKVDSQMLLTTAPRGPQRWDSPCFLLKLRPFPLISIFLCIRHLFCVYCQRLLTQHVQTWGHLLSTATCLPPVFSVSKTGTSLPSTRLGTSWCLCRTLIKILLKKRAQDVFYRMPRKRWRDEQGWITSDQTPDRPSFWVKGMCLWIFKKLNEWKKS